MLGFVPQRLPREHSSSGRMAERIGTVEGCRTGCRFGDVTSGRREGLGQDNAIHSWVMNLDCRVECAWGMRNLLVTGMLPIEENGKSFLKS